MEINTKTKISIEVDDPVILELLPGYVQNRKLEIFQLQRLIESNEFEKIRIIGHNLRGSGGLYGVPVISDFGTELEEGALALDADALSLTVDKMQDYLDRLDI